MSVCNIVAYQQEIINVRWHESQKHKCLYYDCEWFLDALPDLVCTIGGKNRSLLSLPDCAEIEDICPYSGKNG